MATKIKATDTYNLYYAWIPGFSFGFAAFQDENKRNSFELSLAFVRLLWTKDELRTVPAKS